MLVTFGAVVVASWGPQSGEASSTITRSRTTTTALISNSVFDSVAGRVAAAKKTFEKLEKEALGGSKMKPKWFPGGLREAPLAAAGSSWALPDGSRALLGSSWGAPGGSWRALGALLAALGAVLAPLGPLWAPLGALLGLIWAARGLHFGAPGASF